MWLQLSSLSAVGGTSAAAGTAARADRASALERRATPAPPMTETGEQMMKPETALKEIAQRRIWAIRAVRAGVAFFAASPVFLLVSGRGGDLGH